MHNLSFICKRFLWRIENSNVYWNGNRLHQQQCWKCLDSRDEGYILYANRLNENKTEVPAKALKPETGYLEPVLCPRSKFLDRKPETGFLEPLSTTDKNHVFKHTDH